MSKKQTIAYIVLFLILASGLVYSLYLNSNITVPEQKNNSTTPAGSASLFDTDESSSTPSCTLSDGSVIYDPTRCEKIKTYRSEKLGVEFQIHEGADVFEEGNFIYVDGVGGQSVELINKPNLQTLKEKIDELNGPTYKNCRVAPAGYKEFPSTYVQYSDYVHETDFDRSGDGKPLLCQSKYAGNNAMVLFLADSDMATKIAYFKIGQYSVPAGEKLDWFQTFRFIK